MRKTQIDSFIMYNTAMVPYSPSTTILNVVFKFLVETCKQLVCYGCMEKMQMSAKKFKQCQLVFDIIYRNDLNI